MTTCFEEDRDRPIGPRRITFAGAFLDMASTSDRVEVKISLPEGQNPTVFDWRVALSRKNPHRLRRRHSGLKKCCPVCVFY